MVFVRLICSSILYSGARIPSFRLVRPCQAFSRTLHPSGNALRLLNIPAVNGLYCGALHKAHFPSAWTSWQPAAAACSFHTSVKARSDNSDHMADRSNVPSNHAAVSSTGDQAQPAAATKVDSEEFSLHFPEQPYEEEEEKDPDIMDTGKRPPKPELVATYLSEDHFNAAEKYKWRKHELITELQQFEHDTGTMPVQIGLLSERISYLTKHMLVHKKDHSGRRGLLILLSRRRKMLKHYRKKDFDGYVKVLKRFKLKDNYYQSGFGEKYRVGTNLKWTPDQTDKASLPDPEVMRERVQERIKKRTVKKAMVGSKSLTRKKAKFHERSQQLIQNRIRKLNEGWEKRPRTNGEKGFDIVRNEDLDTWDKRLKASKDYMPEELNKPEFELQRLAAAAQRRGLDEEGLKTYRELRAQNREKDRAKKQAEREKLKSTVLQKYGNPLRGPRTGL